MPGRTRVEAGDVGAQPVEDLVRPDATEDEAAPVDPDRGRARGRRFRTWRLGLDAREVTREDAYSDEA